MPAALKLTGVLIAALVLAGAACSPTSPATTAADPSLQAANRPQAGAVVADHSAKADISRPGTYRSGPWEYRLAITGAGSKSQGARGELFHAGKRLQGVQFDYYRTPWGNVQWVGDSELPWGDHGWMRCEPGVTGGRELPEPKAEADGPLVSPRP